MRGAVRPGGLADDGMAFYEQEVNASLAQAVLNRATGTPIADYARARLFAPLAIRGQGPLPENPAAQAALAQKVKELE